MYSMMTLVLSVTSIGFGFLLEFALSKELCWVVVVLQDFVRVIHFFCKKFRLEHTCLAPWMRVQIIDNYAQMGWLKL